MGFKDDLAAAKTAVQAAEPKKTGRIPVIVNGVEHEVVFYRPSAPDWSKAARKSPPRVDVPLDMRNGYDLSLVARDISAKYGRFLDGDDEVVASPEDWADLWDVISLTSARVIEASIWHIVEHDFDKEVEAAKKVSKPRRTSRKKPS